MQMLLSALHDSRAGERFTRDLERAERPLRLGEIIKQYEVK